MAQRLLVQELSFVDADFVRHYSSVVCRYRNCVRQRIRCIVHFESVDIVFLDIVDGQWNCKPHVSVLYRPTSTVVENVPIAVSKGARVTSDCVGTTRCRTATTSHPGNGYRRQPVLFVRRAYKISTTYYENHFGFNTLERLIRVLAPARLAYATNWLIQAQTYRKKATHQNHPPKL